MFDAEKLAKLSPEQLVVAKKWEEDRLKRLSYLDKMDHAKLVKDGEAFYAAYKEYKSLHKDQCEHGRSIWSNCAACDEIERILHPEHFENEEIDKDLKSKINALAKKAGVILNWERDPVDSVQWNGHDIACWEQNASNIIHDIAHFTVSPPQRRYLIDFGLGKGPDSSEFSPRKMDVDLCGREEETASALGIYWEKQLGLDWEGTAQYHGWDRHMSGLSLEETWTLLEKSNEGWLTLV